MMWHICLLCAHHFEFDWVLLQLPPFFRGRVVRPIYLETSECLTEEAVVAARVRAVDSRDSDDSDSPVEQPAQVVSSQEAQRMIQFSPKDRTFSNRTLSLFPFCGPPAPRCS